MPGSFQGNGMNGIGNVRNSMPVVRSFNDGNSGYFELPYFIKGVTKDSTGAALGSCAIVLFRTADNSIAAQGVTSDASGNYSIVASPSLTQYVVAYKAGSPDVAGTSVNTLVGAPA